MRRVYGADIFAGEHFKVWWRALRKCGYRVGSHTARYGEAVHRHCDITVEHEYVRWLVLTTSMFGSGASGHTAVQLFEKVHQLYSKDTLEAVFRLEGPGGYQHVYTHAYRVLEDENAWFLATSFTISTGGVATSGVTVRHLA